MVFFRIFSTVVNESVSLVISRQILTEVSGQLANIPDSVSKVIAHYILEKVCFKQYPFLWGYVKY